MQPADEAAVGRALRAFAAAAVGLAAHELNNRLAVMRETLGLLEDLAAAGKSGAEGTARAHASLDGQVGKTLNIVRAVSALGDALGDAGDAFDAAAALGDLHGLTERWARQRSLAIRLELEGGLLRVAGDPALFLCLAHRLLSRAGDALAPGGVVVLRAGRDGAGIRISVQPTGAPLQTVAAPAAEDERIDRELARRLGGEVLTEGGGATTIVLAASR